MPRFFFKSLIRFSLAGMFFSALDTGVVVENVEPLQDWIIVNFQSLIFRIQLLQSFIPIGRPFRVFTMIVDTVYRGKQDLHTRVQHSLFHIEVHSLLSFNHQKDWIFSMS